MRKEFFALFFAFTLLCVILQSCEDDAAINKILGVGANAPVFISYKAVSGAEVEFQFSVPVKVLEAYVDEAVRFEPFPEDEYALIVTLKFAGDHSGGMSITADLLVEDADGNSLNLLVPFKTRNNRLPALKLNEVRFDYGKNSNGIYTLEFIELRAEADGNLGAMRLFVASTSMDEPVYEFPQAEVKAGDYIVLHMRTKEGDTAKDELGDKLDLSSAKASKDDDVSDTARDLWVGGNEKTLHKADVIYLVDQDDKIIDALVVADSSDAWAKNKTLAKAAELLAKQGAWFSKDGKPVKSPGYTDSVVNDKTTATRTLCRDETATDSNTLSDWYICDTSKATPGEKNSDKRYQGK
ncbi:MAG: hypothetical protein LBB47_02800 [Spirochaetaceae bacterium]|jgi:hypothetical protein|nr:hypothetical protein [Spirochaetaceae bacterium]